MSSIDLSRLNDAQRDVATRVDEPLFVAAGAGSGKTFTLTARLVHALSPGSAPDGGRYLNSIEEALVITFTKAAALEIAERVRSTLRAAGRDDPYLREEALKVDGAWISTIHGMCARILRRHAIELGIDPSFGVCEGSVGEALLARALDEVLSEVQRDEADAALRAEFALWGANAGPSTIAGMIGELRSEAAKCAHGFDDIRWPESHETASLVERAKTCFEALASLKLTAKQRETVEASLAPLAAFCELPPGQRTPAHACEALALAKVPALRKAEQVPLKEDARDALAEAMVCAQYERVQDLAPQLVGLARRVDARYGQLKRERGYLDNDDLIACALAAVRDNPEVARDYAGRFRLVMVDEFQDTDEKQLELIGLLAGEDGCHLTTVGDAQQSIYRFRGGDVAVFRARGRALPEHLHVQMDVNYRSDPHVLALVEKTCGDAELLGDFLRLAADGKRKDGYTARMDEGGRPPRIRLEIAEGGPSELTSATLAAQLADRLASYHAQGQAQGSMALLLGSTAKIDLYLDALRARGLTAVVTGGSSFATTDEVAVVQALLHTLANPHDTQTGLFRLLSSEMFCLDADDFCQLGTQMQDQLEAPTKRPVEQCFVGGELVLYGGMQPSARLVKAHEVLGRAFSRLGRWTLADVCQAAIEESGWLVRMQERGADGLAVAANVLAAVRYVRELTESLGLGVARAAQEFDQWLAAAKLTPKNLVGDALDAVRVMTVHGSKGLQFAVCAVAECWGSPRLAGRLSTGRHEGSCMVCVSPAPEVRDFSKLRAAVGTPEGWDDAHSVAQWANLLDERELAEQAGEKARLLYVALTRAEEALVVGLPVAEREWLQSPLALGMLGAFEELDELEPGECEVSIAPAAGIFCERRIADGAGGTRIVREPATLEPAVARVVRLVRGEKKGDPWQACSAGAMPGFDGVLPEAASELPWLGTGCADMSDEVPQPSFALYDTATPQLPTSGWRPRQGVFSYSSAHALMEAGQTYGKEASPAPKAPPTPPKAQQEAEAEGAAYTNDTDKATSLGSAFHELAQTMVESRRNHDPARLEALAHTWRLSERQLGRLRAAVARWEGSAVRQEALAYELVRAEVPFFVRVNARFGNYVEGAIDLLACDRAGTRALVVDYKTGDVGLTHEQIEDRHRMQANFYAWVLRDQGFAEVECAFVCVEVGDGAGGPEVVRYAFDEHNPPHIDEA